MTRWQGKGHRPPPAHSDEGTSILDLLVAMALIVTVAGIATPLTASALDATRARQAAAFVAAKFRLARHQAAMRGAAVGLVFDHVGGRWSFRLCVDGNRNGLHRTEVTSQVDPCVEGPFVLDDNFAGTGVAVDAALVGPGGEPGSPDAVRLGASDLASFSPTGSATAGTVFVRSARNVHYAVRVAGVTGRTRLLFYDAAQTIWRAT